MMQETSFCVVCLRADRVLSAIEESLFNFHDELCEYALPTDIHVQYCSECEWNLKKFYKFKQKCVRANKILLALHETPPGTNASIFQVEVSPPTLDRWDGRNSQTYDYVFDDGRDLTNTEINLLKQIYDENGDQVGFMVKNDSPNIFDGKSNITEVQLLNPSVRNVNRNTDGFMPSIDTEDSAATSIVNDDEIKNYSDENEYHDIVYLDNVEQLDGSGVRDNMDQLDDSDVKGNVDPLYDDVIADADSYDDNDLKEEMDSNDFDNMITKFSVKKTSSRKNSTDFVTKTVSDDKTNTSKPVKKIVFDLNNKGAGFKVNTKKTVYKPVSEANIDEPLYNEPNKILKWIPERNAHIGRNIALKNNKENQNEDDGSIIIKEEHCYSTSQGDNTNNNLCNNNSRNIPNIKKIRRVDMKDIKSLPIQIQQTVRNKTFERNSTLIQPLKGYYMQTEAGKILLKNIKDGIPIDTLKVDKQVQTNKPVIKNTTKLPKLSKERKDYLNLLSYVKLDKKKPKNKPVKETPETFKTETEEDDDMESQNSTMDINDFKEEIAEMGSVETLEEEVLLYSDDLEKIDHAEFKCETQEEICDGNDTSRKTLTELTNIDIQSDDQEIKVMYVFNPNRDSNESKTDIKYFQIDKEIVDFGPDTVANEEIIEYYEIQNTNDFDVTTDVNESDTTNEYVISTEQENIKTEEITEDGEMAEAGENEDSRDDTDGSSKVEGTLMERKVYMKVRKMFKQSGDIRTADGNVLNKDGILNFFVTMSNEDKWEIAKAIAGTRRGISAQCIDLLWKMQQKYESEYTSIFDIEYLNTEEKILQGFLKRRTYERYQNAEYRCELCIKPFDNKKLLDYHNKWHDPSYGDHVCKLCHTRCKTKLLLYTHSQSHKVVYRCKLCSLVTHRKQVMMSHCSNHKGYRMICQICGQSYSCGSSFNQHTMLHSTSHECNMCARNFASALGLNAHKKFKHADEDVMQSPDRTLCEECDIMYISQEVYQKHYKKVHDKNASKTRSVRTLGSQWIPNKTRADKTTSPKPSATKKKQNPVETPKPDQPAVKRIVVQSKHGNRAAKTFEAATRAIQLAREKLQRQLANPSEETENDDEENSLKMDEDMKLVYEVDVNDEPRVIKRGTAPTYEEITRAIEEARGKTEENEYYYEITDENYAEGGENVESSFEQHFDEITNSPIKRNIVFEVGGQGIARRPSGSRIINAGTQSFKTEDVTTSRTEAQTLTHAVDASKHTITITKRKQGRDMPQLIATHDVDAANSRNVKRRPQANDFQQVLNTDDYVVTSRTVKVGKRRSDIIQAYETVSRDEATSNVKAKRRQEVATMSHDSDVTSSVKAEHDVSHVEATTYDSDASGSRTIEAMTIHAASTQKRADVGPVKKRKKVNVEMIPTYGYVYSTYHP